jgi:cytochrome oxidase Cu insertion factor (SCO1/SenC/PrrC family)
MAMSASETELRARNLRMLAVLAALFLLPLGIAFWMYYGTDWRPARRVNHGELITPPRPLPRIELEAQTAVQSGLVPGTGSYRFFRGRWSLVYIGNGQCDDACRKSLYLMRQTRLSLNAQMDRVERVFLVTSDCCAREFLASEHAGLRVLDASGLAAGHLLAVFPAGQREHSLFVVDPLGNLMMRFDVRQNPKGLLEDLKKLLSLSHIG